MGFFQFLIGNGIAVNGKRGKKRERERGRERERERDRDREREFLEK
jgi:hypothetical protein